MRAAQFENGHGTDHPFNSLVHDLLSGQSDPLLPTNDEANEDADRHGLIRRFKTAEASPAVEADL